MYPMLPESAADLVPLPLCDGPKLKPFGFHKSQNIEFLEYLGEGLHALVFKIRVEGKLYALKLFRFAVEEEWIALTNNIEDGQTMSIVANYTEPFNCECRAYGRLQETGHEDLAIKCYGYLILDEKSEQIIVDQFKELGIDFDCSNVTGTYGMRSRFLDKNGRMPPVRGIVKELGTSNEDLGFTTQDAKNLLRDIMKIQQLGIIRLDVAIRQILDGKISDFSTAVTIPHFQTSPGLNPNLSRDQISILEFTTFHLSSLDYWAFDDMVEEINWDNRKKKKKIRVRGFPKQQTRYNLRDKPHRSKFRFYTHVDPRKQDGILKKRKPAKWYYDADALAAARLRYKSYLNSGTHWDWEIKGGHIFPKQPSHFR